MSLHVKCRQYLLLCFLLCIHLTNTCTFLSYFQHKKKGERENLTAYFCKDPTGYKKGKEATEKKRLKTRRGRERSRGPSPSPPACGHLLLTYLPHTLGRATSD